MALQRVPLPKDSSGPVPSKEDPNAPVQPKPAEE